jgi:hypothetical protein
MIIIPGIALQDPDTIFLNRHTGSNAGMGGIVRRRFND